MSKREFLDKLEKGLSGLPQNEIQERLAFYSEMIDDRMEEGVLEADAVKEMGNIDDIVSQIVSQFPLSKMVKEKIKPKNKLKAWEIILLVLGSPVWLSLLIAVAAVMLSLYITLWSVIASLWAVFASLVGGALGGVAAGIIVAITENAISGIALIGAGLVCGGLSIFMFFGCKFATKGMVVLTKKIILGIKTKLKGEAK